MALVNPNAPSGFRASRSLVRGPSSPIGGYYTLASAYATSLYQQDMLVPDGSGNVGLAAAAGAVVGTFKGVKYVDPTGNIVYANKWLASTATQSGTVIEVEVEHDPWQCWFVQTSTSLTAASQFKFVDLVAGTGNNFTGYSGQTVGSTGGVTFQVLRVIDSLAEMQLDSVTGHVGFGMSLTGTNAIVEVRAVKHHMLGSAGGITA